MIRKPKNGISTCGRSSGGKVSSPISRDVQLPEAMKLPSFGISIANRLRSLAGYVLVYAVIYSFGAYYIFKLLRDGPTADGKAIEGATASRPMAFADTADTATGGRLRTAE